MAGPRAPMYFRRQSLRRAAAASGNAGEAGQGYQIAREVTAATLELINKLLAGRRPTK